MGLASSSRIMSRSAEKNLKNARLRRRLRNSWANKPRVANGCRGEIIREVTGVLRFLRIFNSLHIQTTEWLLLFLSEDSWQIGYVLTTPEYCSDATYPVLDCLHRVHLWWLVGYLNSFDRRLPSDRTCIRRRSIVLLQQSSMIVEQTNFYIIILKTSRFDRSIHWLRLLFVITVSRLTRPRGSCPRFRGKSTLWTTVLLLRYSHNSAALRGLAQEGTS